MEIDIRLAQDADASEISQIILAALYASNSRDYSPAVIARVSLSFSPQALLALIDTRQVFVALVEQKIIGTASLDGHVVRSVFVSPQQQGQGVGRLLMAAVERCAVEAGVEVLSVPSSLTAEGFYARLGFHTVRDIYHGEERTRVMERTLTSRHVIERYADGVHRRQVAELWDSVFGYQTAHNAPPLSIDKKLGQADGLFFVALDGNEVIGTVMAGYDGHRGWLYSVSVDPQHRQKGVGSALVRHAEQALSALGCMKINLQITAGNEQVTAFYEALGYSVEPRVSMGKKVAENIP